MAVVGSASTPYSIAAPANVPHVGSPTLRFAIPPAAYGWATLVLDEEDHIPWVMDGPSTILAGALQDEGSHMEKRIGQIWPR